MEMGLTCDWKTMLGKKLPVSRQCGSTHTRGQMTRTFFFYGLKTHLESFLTKKTCFIFLKKTLSCSASVFPVRYKGTYPIRLILIYPRDSIEDTLWISKCKIEYQISLWISKCEEWSPVLKLSENGFYLHSLGPLNFCGKKSVGRFFGGKFSTLHKQRFSFSFKVVLRSKKSFPFFFRFWKRVRLTPNWQNFELWVLSEGCLFWV